ncbi:MAG: AAA family ATPase [Gemmataceae bacterium]
MALENLQQRVRGGKPHQNSGHSTPKPSSTASSAKPDLFDPGINLAALMKADLPAPKFVADGFLPEGLSILAGRPKMGKSWLALLAAVAVHRGLPCLSATSEARDVLHLALEDTRLRYKDRATKVLRGLSLTPGDRLDVRTNWPRAGKGGLIKLAEWFATHPGGLVIVDTLARFRDPPSGRGSSYDEDYRAVSELKALADKHGGAVLVIHHTRKGAAEDPFDEVSGTLGINGAADALMVLDRQRGVNSAALYITGRDLPDATLNLAWDAVNGLWSLVNRVDGIERPEKQEPENKVDRCARWLRSILEVFAWPDNEIIDGAAKAGFSTTNVKLAKVALRQAEPRLQSRKRGFSDAQWWNWISTNNSPPPDRTEAALRELLGTNGENGENGRAIP